MAGQYIDSNNKCRGFVCRAPNGEAGSILCMPQQPVNLPIVNTIYEFTDDVLQFFGEPSRSNFNIKDELEGLWYSVGDYELGYYIPLSSTKNQVSITQEIKNKRTSNPLVVSNEKGAFSQHFHYENYFEAILGLLTDLYRLYANKIMSDNSFDVQLTDNELKRAFSSDEDIRNAQIEELKRIKKLRSFCELFIVERNIKLSFDLEVIDNVKKASSFEEAMSILNRTGFTTSKKGKRVILFESEELIKNMQYFVENHLLRQPSEFYKYEKVTGVYFLFSNMLEFKIWIESKINANFIITNATELEDKLVKVDRDEGGNFILLNPKPRFYLDPSGVFLIVQNVVYGDLGRAIYVSTVWKEQRRNVGYHSKLFLPSSTPHNVYTISGQELLGVNIIRDAVSVIKYKDGSYAALLPLNI